MKKIILIVLLICSVLAVIFWGAIGLLIYFVHRQAAPLSQPPEHGTAFVIEADLSQMHDDPAALATLRSALETRISNLGIRPFIESISASQMRIVLPITEDKQVKSARDIITRRGSLDFRLVNENSSEIVEKDEPVPPGYELLRHVEHQQDGQIRLETLIVKKESELGLAGNIIKSAKVERGYGGEPQIDFVLNQSSVIAFAKVTRENIGRRLAIVIDGELYSAPVIQSPIETGNGQITGHMDLEEVHALATALNRPLPTAIKILDVSTY